MIPLWLLATALALLGAAYTVLPRLVQLGGQAVGWHLRRLTQQRKELLLARVNAEKKQYEDQGGSKERVSLDDEWEKIDKHHTQSSSADVKPPATGKKWSGVVGFFHPFCNAGGGGERLLWAAVRATQDMYPDAVCVVYTGDHEANKEQMIKRVKERFNIHLHPPTVLFLYLSQRRYVLASTWPRFTLLGQSLGSLVLAHDAFSLLVPDVFIDTMGYAFALALSKFYFPTVPTAAYVHYPTISTDMLSSLDATPDSGRGGIHAGAGAGARGALKRRYWHLFARLYSWVGGSVDIVMTNSSWTQNHIQQLWGSSRRRRQRSPHPIEILYPPCAVEELVREIDVSPAAERLRTPTLLYIAQFRPEKNHALVLRAFAALQKHNHPAARLVLVGSVRDSADETHIYSLRLLAHELHIAPLVSFVLNAPWPAVLAHLRSASVGVNAMYNEHFGIGVVEYQAAGLLSVVNDSGGPRHDIVVDVDGLPTGFHAGSVDEYAARFADALALAPEKAAAMRARARRSAHRFDERSFETGWRASLERLVVLQGGREAA